MESLLNPPPLEVDGDDVDSAIRRAQRGINPDDQRVGSAKVYRTSRGICYSALPDQTPGRWKPVIIGKNNTPEDLPGNCRTERDALQVALSIIETRGV